MTLYTHNLIGYRQGGLKRKFGNIIFLIDQEVQKLLSEKNK